MNKNVVFGGIALLSIAIVAGLLLWEPGAKTPSFESGTVKEEAKEFPKIAIKEKKEQKVRTAASSSKPAKPKKKNKQDFYLKYNSRKMHYSLIIHSPKLKTIINPQWKKIEGTINGEKIVFKIPSQIIDSDLSITVKNNETNQTTSIGTDFLKNIFSLDKNEILSIGIDTANPENISVSFKQERRILPGGPQL